MTYTADVFTERRAPSTQLWGARNRETGIEVHGSRGPEHDLCRALVAASVPDGPIQFFNKEVPSLRFASVHRAAQREVIFSNTSGFRERAHAPSCTGAALAKTPGNSKLGSAKTQIVALGSAGTPSQAKWKSGELK